MSDTETPVLYFPTFELKDLSGNVVTFSKEELTSMCAKYNVTKLYKSEEYDLSKIDNYFKTQSYAHIYGTEYSDFMRDHFEQNDMTIVTEMSNEELSIFDNDDQMRERYGNIFYDGLHIFEQKKGTKQIFTDILQYIVTKYLTDKKLSEIRNEEMVSMVQRQTDYSREYIQQRLQENGNNMMEVIREYIAGHREVSTIEPPESNGLTTNQKIYKEIRTVFDKSAKRFYDEREKNSNRQ